MAKIELESKFCVSSRTAKRIKEFFAKRLHALANDEPQEEKQVNYYFYPVGDNQGASEKSIRLRVSPSGAILTLKSRVPGKKTKQIASGRYKRRREEEFPVPGETMLDIFRALGATEVSYEKLRTHCPVDFYWARPKDPLMNSGTYVDVDFVPELDQHFVEIEAESTKIINRLVKELGLSWDDVEPKSYIQLIREFRDQKKNKKRS